MNYNISLDILIVNWNSGGLLKNCVNSILQSSFSFPVKIIIVDNASGDDSLENLPSDNRIIISRQVKNHGFAKACNIGLGLSNNKYLLLLNPDVEVYQDTLEKSVKFIDIHPEYSILGIMLLDEKGHISRHCNRYPKPIHFINSSLKLTSISPKFFKDKIMFDWDHKVSNEVDHVIGAYMLIRRSLINKIGFMDERFFVYLEDLDFSVRARNAGDKIFYNADIKAYHKGEGTSYQVKAKRLFYANQSVIEFSKKCFSRWAIFSIKSAVLFIEPVIRIAFSIATFNFRSAKETLEAYKLLYNNNLK